MLLCLKSRHRHNVRRRRTSVLFGNTTGSSKTGSVTTTTPWDRPRFGPEDRVLPNAHMWLMFRTSSYITHWQTAATGATSHPNVHVLMETVAGQQSFCAHIFSSSIRSLESSLESSFPLALCALGVSCFAAASKYYDVSNLSLAGY